MTRLTRTGLGPAWEHCLEAALEAIAGAGEQLASDARSSGVADCELSMAGDRAIVGTRSLGAADRELGRPGAAPQAVLGPLAGSSGPQVRDAVGRAISEAIGANNG